MGKILRIEVVDTNSNSRTVDRYARISCQPILTGMDTNYITSQFDYDELDGKDLTKTVDRLVSHMVKDQVNIIVVDLETRNNLLRPAKEMTIAEIEKELGYKIKIVGKINSITEREEDE